MFFLHASALPGIQFFSSGRSGLQSAHSSFPCLSFLGATSIDKRFEHLPDRILDITHTHPDPALISDQRIANEVSEQVLATGPRVTGRTRRCPELNGPQEYLRISRFLLTTGFVPHWIRPTGPDTAGVTTRQEPWRRVYFQVREHIDCPDWEHAGYAGAICHIILGSLRGVAHCEYPLFLAPFLAGELIQLRNLVVSRRIGRHGRSPGAPPDAKQRSKDHCGAV